GHDPASLPADEVASICADATGQVLADCVRAEAGFDNIRTSMRAQYAEAGAPYSSGTPQHPDAGFSYDSNDPVVRMQNSTGLLWVMNINDFFARGGYSSACQASTSADPCGPGVGNYRDTAFNQYGSTQPMRYGANGGYTTWQAATAADWETITANWTGQDTTLGQLMRREGFTASASTPRVYFTGTVDTHNHDKSYTFGNDTWHYRVKEVACFVATPLRKKDAHQPFCSKGIGRLMKTSGDHLNSNKPCFTAESQSYRPLEEAGIASPFFDFLYTMQNYTCKSKAHPEPRTYYPAPPGWILQYRSWKNNNTGTGIKNVARRQHQYHWPVLDTRTLTCTTEPATGKRRSRFALNGRTTVPTMCGADFDAWFNKWIAPPAQISDPPIGIPTSSVRAEPKRGENMSTAIEDLRPAESQASGPSSADALVGVRHHRGPRASDDLPRRLSP
ncbi:MAG TPA: hypothetical protein VE127_01590, partial [Solirubrobacteraceae bacterium]|nr:hypothetical protein [Solirubrobacteraceae bacterium]